MCKPAGFKYYIVYNGYGSLNISELHGLSTVACSLFYTVCRNRFVETSLEPGPIQKGPGRDCMRMRQNSQKTWDKKCLVDKKYNWQFQVSCTQ